ncbi:MAG: hypothetical protein WBI07_03805 [Mobilitalea sp.]
MIKIIDSTLAMLDDYLPNKEQVLQFCLFMKEIGINDLEISKYVYHMLDPLPSDIRFYLHLDAYEKKVEFQGIYHFFVPHSENQDKIICEVQMNDSKEIVHLRTLKELCFVRIKGLDDLLCHDYLITFKEIQKIFGASEVIFCPEDTFRCATALAVEWLLLGGKSVTTSFASIGKRAATEEVYMAMNVVKRFKPNQSLGILVRLKELFENITKQQVSLYKPVIGERIFCVESGIHVDGILKNPANYEAYPPEKVGQKTRIVLGKYSGTSSVINQCEVLSLEKPDETRVLILLGKIKQMSVQNRRSVSDEEFLSLYQEVIAYE